MQALLIFWNTGVLQKCLTLNYTTTKCNASWEKNGSSAKTSQCKQKSAIMHERTHAVKHRQARTGTRHDTTHTAADQEAMSRAQHHGFLVVFNVSGQPSTFIRRTISTVQLTWRLCSVVGKTWDFRRKSTISNHCQQPTMQSIFQGSTARKYQIILSTKYPRYLEKSTRISLHFNEFCWDEPVFKQYSATFDHYTIQFEISWHFLANLVVKSCTTVNECHWIIHSSCWPFNLKTELPTAHS